MLTIYVRKLSSLCVLAFILNSLACFADTTTAGGGSGGLSEVQNRLEGVSGETREVSEAKRNLLSAIEAKVPENDRAAWIKMVDSAGARPQYALEVQAADMATALNELSKFLTNNGALERARKTLAGIATPEEMPVQDSISALFQTIAYKSPSKYVQFQLSPNGHGLLIPNNTIGLQRLYDQIVGTEKPLTILKNDREFLMVQPSGTLELFADDTQYVVQTTSVNSQPFKPKTSNDEGFAASLRGDSITRQIVLDGKEVIEKTTVSNGSAKAKNFIVDDTFSSDFKDMFEVRGWKRDKRGEVLPAQSLPSRLRLAYKGLDGQTVATGIYGHRHFQRTLKPHQTISYETIIVPSNSEPTHLNFSQVKAATQAGYNRWRSQAATIQTDNPSWNRMLERGWKDLYMLKQRTAGGVAIAAGTPWFAAPFGRDQLITSMQMLVVRPEIARNVLLLLAHYQGTKNDPYRAEKPGKIMHELRIGEMARNKEIPFTPYYGTVDATPLFLDLMGRYIERTGDTELATQLKPNVEAALKFLERETAETGYLRYGGVGKEALSNQGWKDSGDSIAYSDGRLAKAPIALSEVQGYLYEAYKWNALSEKAAQLQKQFHRDFWMKDKNFMAIALDGDMKQVDVVSSNPGHLLSSGMLWHPDLTASRLMQPDMFTGYGIRTLSSKEKRYFPNSYHNGSVWPHDVSLIAYGMHNVDPKATAQLADALLNAAKYQNDFRLPELFGGYSKSEQNIPIPYPVACEPQAWAAGTPFMLLSACSGVHIDAAKRTVRISHPQLPQSINKLSIRNLQVTPKDSVALEFTRSGNTTAVRALENAGKLNIIVEK